MGVLHKLFAMITAFVSIPKEIAVSRKELNLLRKAYQEMEYELKAQKQSAIEANKYANEYRSKYVELSNNYTKVVKAAISHLIEISLRTENPQQIYNRLRPLDSEGWAVYNAAKEILNIDIYKEFVVEDSMGRFEESDGFELLHYAEIARFGDCSYKIVGNTYEVLDTYNIDKSSNEYNDYLSKLFPLAIKNIVDRINYNKDVDYHSVIESFLNCRDSKAVTLDAKAINPSNKEPEYEMEL